MNRSDYFSVIDKFKFKKYTCTDWEVTKLIDIKRHSLRIQPPLIRSRYYVVAGANERRLYSQAMSFYVNQFCYFPVRTSVFFEFKFIYNRKIITSVHVYCKCNIRNVKFRKVMQFKQMFVTADCVLFLLKQRILLWTNQR